MKTLLSACLCSLALALTSLAQSPPPPAPPQPSPPGAPPPAVSPGAVANPAAPAQLPATSAPPGGPAAPAPPGAATSPAAPGATISATLSPAPATAQSPSPAAEEKTSGGVLGSNWLIDKFRKGGPIMWPILIVSIIGLTVVIERIFWWGGRWFRRDPKRIEKVFTAIENGDTAEASRLARGSRDPVLRMIWNGLNHQHASLQGALQVAAGIEIKRAGRFLGVLGTITGLIRSFSFLGNEELAVQAVTGGIAEALIATACGLGIAIFALIPFNFFTSRVSNLEFELQTAATNLEVMLQAHGAERHVSIESGAPSSATRSSI